MFLYQPTSGYCYNSHSIFLYDFIHFSFIIIYLLIMIIIFYYLLFFILLIFCSFFVILSKNPVHSVFFLILVFLLVSLLFMLLGAEFLSILVLVIYVGAVSILFLFVVICCLNKWSVIGMGGCWMVGMKRWVCSCGGVRWWRFWRGCCMFVDSCENKK